MLLEGGISVLKRWSVYYFGNWLLSGQQTWFLREKKSTLEVKTQGNVELWRLLGEQHRHSPSLWQEPGAGRIQLLLLPPTATTAPFLGNDFSSDPLIPAQSLPKLAAPGKVLQHSKEQFWSGSINPFVGTHGGSCSSVEMGFSCLYLG